jgi:flagellum-specific peptidoglycan hydrolase FlgJ
MKILLFLIICLNLEAQAKKLCTINCNSDSVSRVDIIDEDSSPLQIKNSDPKTEEKIKEKNKTELIKKQKISNDSFVQTHEGSNWFTEIERKPPPLREIFPGKTAFIEITQDIVASPNVPAPIRAKIKNGNLTGAILLGEARLDNDLNRVLITFKNLHFEGDDYKIFAQISDHNGNIGITGEFISENKGMLAGGFLSTFFSVFSDSSVERHKNEQGNYVDEPSVGNAVKKGLSGTLSKSADRMIDEAQKMKGYTVIKGPTLAQIIFEESHGR